MVLLVLSTLMTSHWIPLPTPDSADSRLHTGLSLLLLTDGGAAPSNQWTTYHVLYSGCRCSRQVFDYLAARLPGAGHRDVVLLVGGNDEELETVCATHAVPCLPLSQEQLEQQLGIESAPLFIATDPAGVPRYVGGYTDRKQSLDYRDLEVLARLQAGESVQPLPVFGCGVSTSLQDALDPFGIKY